MLEGYWRPMTFNDAVQIAPWHYSPPYDFYDADRDEDDLQELLDATTWLPDSHWVLESPGRVMGFVTFDVTPNGLWIGLGLRPDMTGMGAGRSFLQKVLALARKVSPGRPWRLAVAAVNQRAIRTYQAVGFVEMDESLHETNGGRHLFLQMEYRGALHRGD